MGTIENIAGQGIVCIAGKHCCFGDLDLRHTKITTLPDNLIVWGNLSLTFSAITKLPNNLVVCGSLDLSKTDINTHESVAVIGRVFWN